jgi:peroxiredoxin
MLPDGNGDFSRDMGMLVDKTDLGFGERSWRYAMVVDDGVIEEMFVEDFNEPGDPFAVSDVGTVLAYLEP